MRRARKRIHKEPISWHAMQLLELLYGHKNEFVPVPDGANRAMVASLVKREWIEIKREGAISYVRMTGRGLVAYRTAEIKPSSIPEKARVQ